MIERCDRALFAVFLSISISFSIGCIGKSAPPITGDDTSSKTSEPSTPAPAKDDPNESPSADKDDKPPSADAANGVSCKADTDCNPWHCTCSTAGGDLFQQLVSLCKNGACADANSACDPPGKNICGAGSYWTGWAYGGPAGK